jgi:hypothetical protein
MDCDEILPTVFVAILLHSDASLAGARCDDVAARGFLKALTINLLFSEVDERDERLEILAQFIRRNEVDLILLQEVVSGRLADTSNSAKHRMPYHGTRDSGRRALDVVLLETNSEHARIPREIAVLVQVI